MEQSKIIDMLETYQPSMPILCYMEGFDLQKIIRKLSGRSAAVPRRNLGRSNLGLRWNDSAGETSLVEGEIKIIVITTTLSSWEDQSSSTSSPAPSHLKP